MGMMATWVKGLLGSGKLILDKSPGVANLVTTAKGRPVPSEEEWARVKAVAQEPFKVLVLTMQAGEAIEQYNEEKVVTFMDVFILQTATNHFLTLVSARGEDCVTWTWGELVSFDCNNLR